MVEKVEDKLEVSKNSTLHNFGNYDTSCSSSTITDHNYSSDVSITNLFASPACTVDTSNNSVDEGTDDGELDYCEQDDTNTALRNIRLQNRNGLLIAYLNINSIRNKIDFLRPMISEAIDILVIAETKIDHTFPTSQFVIEGFMKPFRYDRNQAGGGLLIYVRERKSILVEGK